MTLIASPAEYQAVAAHESAHAAAATLLGILPVRVEVGGHPEVAGRVTGQSVDLSSRAAARRNAQVLLAGWIGNDEDPPRWPPSEQAPKGSAERKLATLTRRLGLDPGSYAALRAEAWRLAARPELRLLEHGFKTALSYRPVLDSVLISQVLLAALPAEQVAGLYRRAARSQKERDVER